VNFEALQNFSEYTIEILGFKFPLLHFAISIVIAIFLLYSIIVICIEIFAIYFDYKRAEKLRYIQVKIPRQDAKEEKDELGEEYGQDKTFIKLTTAMKQLLDGFSSIKSGTFIRKYFTRQDYISLEYVVEKGMIKYVLAIPESFMQSASKQITALYPASIIEPISKPEIVENRKYISGGHLHYNASYVYPLKSMEKMDADPMNNVLNALSKVKSDDKIGIQILIKPATTSWRRYILESIKKLKKGETIGFSLWSIPLYPFTVLINIIKFLIGHETKESEDQDISTMKQSAITAMEEKLQDKGYDTIIRVLTASNESQEKANGYWSDVANSMVPFGGVGINSLSDSSHHSIKFIKKHFEARYFSRPLFYWTWNYIFTDFHEWEQIMSSSELTALYHFPNIKFNTSPQLDWQDFKMTPPPNNLPKKGVLLGVSEYQGETKEVRIKPDDRMRHFYMIGKSGTGKSTLLTQMINQDIKNGHGICLVDPHGDLVEGILPFIPPERADDVIVFDPGDLEHPMGLNILDARKEDEKEFMANEAMAIFIKLFGEEVFSARLQNYFINAVHTLMSDDEDPATILDILRIFTDDKYRERKIKNVTKPSVLAFWQGEYANSADREKKEIIPYLASKFTPFVTNSQIRNIIGQGRSSFDFSEVMNNKKILLVNLSKGKLGDLNAQLLGMIIVSKIQMAAMARTSIPENERQDFFLYVDEFQNFVTESFASILSEARKYRLGLIIAHQYISQITKMQTGGKGSQEDHTIKDAVFGNVGSMMNFKIGAQDAEMMAKEFKPVFSETDLINIPNYHAFIKLNIDNTTSRGFVMKTLYDDTKPNAETAEAFKELSRLKYCKDRTLVEENIKKKLLGTS